MSFLNCCASLCCQQMIAGSSYTFHFKYSGLLGIAVTSSGLESTLKGDSNFLNPTATVNPGGLLKDAVVSVSFTYAGQGSLVGQAGQEMQNVMNNFWTTGIGTSLVFTGAEQGIVADAPDNAGPSLFTWIIGGIAIIALIGFFAPEIISFEAFKRLRR